MAACVVSALPALMPRDVAASTVYYWDGGGPATGQGPQDGSGIWNQVNLNWLAGSPTASDTNWTDGNEANFSNNSTGSSAYTVTLGSNITTSQIDLNNPGTGASYTFNLSGFTLTTLSSASGDGVNIGAGSNTTFINGTLVDMPNSQTTGHPGFSMRGGSITLAQGAVVETDYISSNTPTTTGYQNAMYFNGATLEPVWGNDEPVLYATSGGSTSSAFKGAFIGAGGLTVNTSYIESGDTANSDIYLSLSHLTTLSTADGGLTKTGSGSLYLDATSSYTGPTTVNGGTLALNAYETESVSNYVVNSGATLMAAAGNSVVGVSGTNLVTLNSNATLTSANGVTAHLAGVALNNGAVVTSGTPDPTYGSWAINSNGYLLVSNNATATFSATNWSMASGGYLGVNLGATLLVTGNYVSGSTINLYGGGLTVFSGNNVNASSGTVVVNSGATLQLQANATNTVGGVSYALGNLGSGGFTMSGTASLQLRSDSSVNFAGTTAIGGAYEATYNFDVNNAAAVTGSGPQGNTISIGSFATYGTTINVTGGNGYTLAIGAITNGYGQPAAVNAVSANVTFGSIGVSGSGVGSLGLNASGGTIAVAGTIINTGATTVKGASNVTLAGSVQGTNLIMNGTGTLTLEGSNAYTGVTQVNSGTLLIAPDFGSGIQTVALPGGLNIAAGAVTQVATVGSHSNRALLQAGKLNIAGSSNSWTGRLDLGNNDLDLASASLATVSNQVAQGYNNGNWNGSGGIVSSAAAADFSHLTALGVISNNVSGSALYASDTGSMGLFDGIAPGLNDVLVKFTYYGDTDLSGSVDGTDYARIDNGYLNHLTGWFNGDFNYDGVVNASDYTLIDNAFNSQGASLAASVAGPSVLPTAQLAGSLGAASGTSAVPEPASIGILALLSTGLIGRRKRA